MAGNVSRNKGRRGQCEASMLLRNRDWSVAELNGGTSVEDFIAKDPGGQEYCIEVKNCAGILPGHRKQAMRQAEKRRLPWMLMSKIEHSSSWLVRRQSKPPAVWHAKGEDSEDA